jgi:hypothetical protein
MDSLNGSMGFMASLVNSLSVRSYDKAFGETSIVIIIMSIALSDGHSRSSKILLLEPTQASSVLPNQKTSVLWTVIVLLHTSQ